LWHFVECKEPALKGLERIPLSPPFSTVTNVFSMS
jgi:hypothetical protein